MENVNEMSLQADPNGNCNVCPRRSICKRICSRLEKRLSPEKPSEHKKFEIQMSEKKLIYFSDLRQTDESAETQDEVLMNSNSVEFEKLYELFFVQKLSQREIAKVLKTSQSTVFRRISEMLKALELDEPKE